MEPIHTSFIPILLVLFLVLYTRRIQRNAILKNIIKGKQNKEKKTMQELATRFVGKECLIYTFSGNQIVGMVKEVSSGALLLENKGTVEAVNLDFIVRIREYPRNKNGKKKAVILD